MEKQSEGCWVSLILRLAVASLFIGAAIPKWMGPSGATAMQFEAMFKDSWLPLSLVKLHGQLVPWIEALIPIWLLLGFRLRLAWAFTALFLVSLAFGLIAVKQDAAHNYLYVLIACAGLHFSQFDRFSVDGFGRKDSCCSS